MAIELNGCPTPTPFVPYSDGRRGCCLTKTTISASNKLHQILSQTPLTTRTSGPSVGFSRQNVGWPSGWPLQKSGRYTQDPDLDAKTESSSQQCRIIGLELDINSHRISHMPPIRPPERSGKKGG